MQQSSVKKFCEIIRKRSKDHKQAMLLVSPIHSVAAAILRMELDSMVRVLYLLSITEIEERIRLIEQTLSNKKWTSITEKGKWKKISDKDMVDHAYKFRGWALLVYQLGCSFIHLTSYHDYPQSPLELMDESDKENILRYMRQYHGGPQADNPSFKEFASYFPNVLEKIADNLECYVRDLEKGEILEVIL